MHGGVGLLRVFSDVLWVLVFVFLYFVPSTFLAVSYGICSYTYQSAAELAHIVAKDGTKINIQESPSWGTWRFFVSLLFVPFNKTTTPLIVSFFVFFSFLLQASRAITVSTITVVMSLICPVAMRSPRIPLSSNCTPTNGWTQGRVGWW